MERIVVAQDGEPFTVSAWSHDHPDTTVRTGPPGTPLTIRTIVRTGDRISPNGWIWGVATNVPDVVAGVVWEFLVERPIGLDRDDPGFQAEARSQSAAAEQAGQALGANFADPALWSFRPIRVDGVEYGMRVHAFPDGFIATVDLGPEVVTLRGRSLPDGLVLVRRPIAEPSLPSDPA